MTPLLFLWLKLESFKFISLLKCPLSFGVKKLLSILLCLNSSLSLASLPNNDDDDDGADAVDDADGAVDSLFVEISREANDDDDDNDIHDDLELSATWNRREAFGIADDEEGDGKEDDKGMDGDGNDRVNDGNDNGSDDDRDGVGILQLLFSNVGLRDLEECELEDEAWEDDGDALDSPPEVNKSWWCS